MSHQLLLPNKYKKIGWIILIPAFIAGIIISISGYEASWLHARVFTVLNVELFGNKQFFSFIEANITNTVVGILFIVGALLVSFSKEKTEDEFIAKLRLSSLLWATLVSYILLLFAFVFIYGL